jgi:CPA2 family monovalent cation:H+ antiporter-2
VTALRTAGLVAQAGEFSFVLATVGLQLGAISQPTFSQAMGAAVISIVLAGPVAAASARMGEWLERRAPSPAAPPEVARGLRRHVVLLGYGSVGRTVARVLQARSIPWVAIDADYRLVRAATAGGLPVLYGDAGTLPVLEAAAIDEATMLVAAISDPLATRQAIQHAMRRNPRLHVVVRAHSEAEQAELQGLGAARVITAERQLGHELLRHTLLRYGISAGEIDLILRRRG